MRVSLKDDKFYVSQYINGKQSAFQILINRHQSKVFGFIFSKVKDKDIANDIFQDTFMKVVKTLQNGKYNEEGKFLPWVMRIAHNLIIDHFRKQKKMKMVRGTDEFDIFNVIGEIHESKEDQIIKSQIHEDLHKLIELLPELQKDILKKRIFQEMSFNEIAEKNDISINTALGRMRYSLINLRKLMDKHNISLTL
ncbi:MAG: RNA polymerase sigma factor [Flavobacteriales bacterium]